MGRELKRVAMNFDWPLRKVWKGYINPHYKKCPPCKGRGTTTAMNRLEDLIDLLMLSVTDTIDQKLHRCFYNTRFNRSVAKICGPDLIELVNGLADQEQLSHGYTSLWAWRVTKKIIKAAGLPESWGICLDCDGRGVSREHYAAYCTWKRTDPPKGIGYQLWETVTEGSPITPVFATPEELARCICEQEDKNSKEYYEIVLRFIKEQKWSVSAILDGTVFYKNIETVVCCIPDKTKN